MNEIDNWYDPLNKLSEIIANMMDVAITDIKSNRKRYRILSHARAMFVYIALNNKIDKCYIKRYLDISNPYITHYLNLSKKLLKEDKFFKVITNNVNNKFTLYLEGSK